MSNGIAHSIITEFVFNRRVRDLQSGLVDSQAVALETDKIVSEWLTDARNEHLLSIYTFVVVDLKNKKVLCGCNSLFDVVYQKAFVPESVHAEVWNLKTGDVYDFNRVWGEQTVVK